MHRRRKRLGQDMNAPKRAYQRTIIPLGGHQVGEFIGARELIEYGGTNSVGHHLWFWLCPECKEKRGPSTVGHLGRRERCNQCAMARQNNPRWRGYKELTGVWLSEYRHGAETRNLAWDITPEDIWSQWIHQDGRCVYTGWLLTHGKDASLDRINSAIGYVAGNIQFVHKDINRLKWNLDNDYFMQLCQAVVIHSISGSSQLPSEV
jgi:hypothetical protein